MLRNFTILFILLLSRPAFSQSFWERVPGPNGLNVKSIQYSPDGTFYATDNTKRIFRSTDAGLSWTEIHGPVNGLEIRALQVGYKGTLFCLGEDWATLYRSFDLGETWSIMPIPYYFNAFTETSNGSMLIASEGSILRTFDGSLWDTIYFNQNHWSSFNIIQQLGWLPDGTLVASSNSCYYPSSGLFFLISQDNGVTWDSLPGSGPIAKLAALGNGEYIFSDNYSCSDVYKTSKGGAAVPLNGVNPNEESCVVTAPGTIIVSNYYKSRISFDSGLNWQDYDGNVYGSLANVPLPGNILLRGRGWSGNFMRSTNLGKSWKFSGYGVENSWVYNWTFKGQDIAFALTSNGLWRTFDGGEHWQIAPVDSETTNLEFSIYNLALSSTGDVYVCRPHTLQRSTDNGTTFQNISPDPALGNFARVAVHPQTNDLYLSGDSVFLKSSDQGQTWQKLNSVVRFNYRPILFHPSGTFYGIVNSTAGSILVRSDDGGVSWQQVNLPPASTNLANDVEITSDGKIIVTYYGEYATSTDNGITWNRRHTPADMSNFILNAEGHAYIADINNKKIFKTENDGYTWTSLPNIPSDIFTGTIDMAFDSRQRLWVCTDGDGYFRTVESTVSTQQPVLETSAPECFPNPAQGGFWIKRTGETRDEPTLVRLRDLSGRVVLTQTLFAFPAYIEVPYGSSGMFIVELTGAHQPVGIAKVFLK